MILVGDIGGTETVLALYEGAGSELRARADASYASRDFSSLEEIVSGFLADHPEVEIEVACFGIAGAVIDGCAEATNLPWDRLDQNSLAVALNAREVLLLNDLEATAYGMLGLGPDDRLGINPGAEAPVAGNAAVIAAGTGLGQAILFWDGERHHVVASEGGHADFAPRSDQQIALLRFIRRELGGRVSVERVLSGPGLHNIYRFLRAEGDESEPAWLGEAIDGGDPSAAIAAAGLDHRDAVCDEALDLFAAIYGAEAGDLALRCVAVAGVYIGGGIAPKILPSLQSETFLRAFTDKGRFSSLVGGIEVSVALNPHTALLGAALQAARL